VNENGTITDFMLYRINKVELTEKEKPIFYTDKVLVIKINGREILEYAPYFENVVNIDELKKL
jgi:hypothetical protein